MKTLKAKTILLVSAISYFLATGLGSLGDFEVLASALNLLGFITLAIGVVRYITEAKKEKK